MATCSIASNPPDLTTSANASDSETCVLIATMVVESEVVAKGPGALVIVDEEYKDVVIGFEQ